MSLGAVTGPRSGGRQGTPVACRGNEGAVVGCIVVAQRCIQGATDWASQAEHCPAIMRKLLSAKRIVFAAHQIGEKVHNGIFSVH